MKTMKMGSMRRGGREGVVVRMVVGSRGGREMRGLGEHRLLGGCIFQQILDVSPN